jgi:hypothetical protein
MRGGTKSWPSVYMSIERREAGRVAEVVRVAPASSASGEVGSTATRRTFRPAALSAKNGNAIPPKFEPPPHDAKTASGYSPTFSSWRLASRPITLWCSSTWFSTEPSE